jgi:hypothetical protein
MRKIVLAVIQIFLERLSTVAKTASLGKWSVLLAVSISMPKNHRTTSR